MKYYLDSSFVFSLLIEKHIFHEKALEFLEENKGKYYISTLTLLEIIYNLQKIGHYEKIKEFLDIAKEFIVLEFHFEDILEATKIKELRIFDALHYVLAKKVGAKLVTFDKNFKGLKYVITCNEFI